jgi:hypothetical protein
MDVGDCRQEKRLKEVEDSAEDLRRVPNPSSL